MLAFESVISGIWQYPAFPAASNRKDTETTSTSSVKLPSETEESPEKKDQSKQIKDYVVIVTTAIILLQYICCKQLISLKSFEEKNLPTSKLKQSKMGDRLNIGREVRELKLGSTFNTQNSQTAFHTIKYDFKPASVDLNRVATVDVGSNNQVTVTVPNLESSGVPHTVYKGNQRKYTKECIIIYDRKTGVMTLEKLNNNIQVKKTRSENTSKAIIPPPQKIENHTQRTSSKTKVSTGSRKNNIIGFVPRNSPLQQGSPSPYSSNYNKNSQASSSGGTGSMKNNNSSRWNANNAQSTLPSIPLIEVDDDMPMLGGPGSLPVTGSNNTMSTSNSISSSAPINVNNSSNNLNEFNHLHLQQQQQHLSQTQYHNQSSSSSLGNTNVAGQSGSSTLSNTAASLGQEIGVLSSSESSSDSDSSGSGSDSDDSDGDDDGEDKNIQHNKQSNPQQVQSQSYVNGSFPTLLHDDLQLSESCSSDSDDD